MSEYKQILKLALKRRETLIKQLDRARVKGDDTKCDQLCLWLSVENDNIGYCKQQLEAAE
jgi:hypothetical protein